MDGFAMEVLRRLPLAQSVLSIFAYVLSEPFLDLIFAKHRKRYGTPSHPSLTSS